MPIGEQSMGKPASNQNSKRDHKGEVNPVIIGTPTAGNQNTDKRKLDLRQILGFVILLFIVIPAIIANIFFFQQVKKSQSVEIEKATSQSTRVETPQLSEGEETINIKPGGKFVLADGVNSIHLNGGSENAVPNIIFGKDYNLNDIHAINYLDIRKELSFYSGGYYYKLTNLGCNKAQKFDIDVIITVVTDCNLRIATKKEPVPLKSLTSFSKSFHTTQLFAGQINSPNELFIFVMLPKLSLQNYSTRYSSENVNLQAGSMTSYSSSSFWDITFVTGYGIETIRYSAEELWSKANKEISVGPLHINSKIIDFACSVIYTGSDGEETQRCDDIPVELSFDQIGQQIPIKILSYSN